VKRCNQRVTAFVLTHRPLRTPRGTGPRQPLKRGNQYQRPALGARLTVLRHAPAAR
jgi:hypothetical protein